MVRRSVLASFHAVKYAKPVLAPPKRLAGQVPGLRFWRPLNIGGDFAHFREHPGRRGLYPHLRPAFKHWAFYAVWDDEAALDDFLSSSSTGKKWQESAAEACHFWLRPLHARGSWAGISMLDSSDTAPGGAPVAHLIRLDLSLRGTVAMWGSAAPNLLHHLPESTQLLLGLPLVDRPYAQPVSFSVWRTRECALDFAYRGEAHPAAVERVRRSQSNLLQHYSAGSFEPYRSAGTWGGRRILD
jgi:hypothetical protein